MIIHSIEEAHDIIKFFKKEYSQIDLSNQLINLKDFIDGVDIEKPINNVSVDISVNSDGVITLSYSVDTWDVNIIFFQDNQVHIQECVNHITKFENVKRAILYAKRFLCL